MEAAHYGVPLLAISLFADQHRNAKMLEYRKTAVVLPKNEITEATLFESLKLLMHGNTGEGYRKSAKSLAATLASRPMSPRERFAKHVDFAIKNAVDYLDIEIRKHDFVKYYNLDIYGIIILSVSVLSSLLFMIFKIVWIILIRILKKKVKKL